MRLNAVAIDTLIYHVIQKILREKEYTHEIAQVYKLIYLYLTLFKSKYIDKLFEKIFIGDTCIIRVHGFSDTELGITHMYFINMREFRNSKKRYLQKKPGYRELFQ